MRRKLIAIATAMMVLVGATAAYAHDIPKNELTELKQATAKYHKLENAMKDGFVAFSLDPNDPDTPTCFDSPTGGMGLHYVRNIDGVVDANDPEAMVYEVRPNRQRKLVAVEYIVPETEVDPANPPMLYGHMFHPHPFLPVYILHVWVWKANPDGLFADFNPNVTPCP
jgi:hypothetical protein